MRGMEDEIGKTSLKFEEFNSEQKARLLVTGHYEVDIFVGWEKAGLKCP